MKDAPPVIPVPRAQRVEALRRQALPIVVWTAAAALVSALLVERVGYVQYTGLAHSLECQVSPTVVGRVEAVAVALNDRVTPGDIVALLDDAQIDASVGTANATIRKLRADLSAAAASLAADSGRVATDLLRLQMDEDSRRLDALALRGTLSSDAVEIDRLALESQRLSSLAARGLVPQSQFDNARLQHDALRTRGDQMKVVLAQTESEWAAAKARREAYERRLPAGQGEQILLAPLRETIAVEESRLREIELLRAALVLRSPVVGQVSQVWSSAGQSVRPGDPIVTIVESSVRDIIVYVADSDARRIPQRTPVLVTRRVVPRAASESVVVSVGESVQQLPPRLWRDPRVPDYGRAVVVAPVRELNLTSGELVDVKMLPSR